MKKRARTALTALLAAGCLAALSCALRLPPDDSARALEEAPPSDFRPPRLGEETPDFRLPDLEGRALRLAELRGRIVVLEWIDPDCSFVQYAHRSGTLRALAERLPREGVAWIAINSTGRGKPGSSREENRRFCAEHQLETPVLLDATGEVGRAYGATKAPELFVLDENGVLAYAGPPDNAPFGQVKGGGPLVSYVEETVRALRTGAAIEPRRAKSYGCAIRYAAD